MGSWSEMGAGWMATDVGGSSPAHCAAGAILMLYELFPLVLAGMLRGLHYDFHLSDGNPEAQRNSVAPTKAWALCQFPLAW